MKHDEIAVGTVSGLWRYPVKSLAGESIAATTIGWHGVAGDRRYALVKSGNETGFPWLTLRDCPGLVRYQAYLEDPNNVRGSAVLVRTPTGEAIPVTGSIFLEQIKTLASCNVHLLQHYGGIFDCADISIITDKTLAGLAAPLGVDLDVRRFRPNIVIAASEDRAFPEDKWLGAQVVFGERSNSARLRINRKDPRCSVTGVDPVTGEKANAIPHAIVQNRKNLAGVYATSQFCGTVEVGDSVRLLVG